MSQERSSYRGHPRRASVAFEEEKAWVAFYRRMGDPSIAAELIQHLDSDPEMKRAHAALYLGCKQSLRRNKERQVRAKRIGYFVRMIINSLLVNPLIAMRRALRNGTDIAIECLPEIRKEPAVRKVENLSKESEFAQAQSTFDDQAATPAKQSTAEQMVKNAQ